MMLARRWNRPGEMLHKETWDFLYKPHSKASSEYSRKFEGNLIVAINELCRSRRE